MSLISGKFNTFKACKNVYGGILVGFSFLLLTLITVKTFAPEVKSEAANQTASQTVGPYTMSMSNDSVTNISIVPTASQQIYSASNNLSVINTCPAGASITMTTNSTSSNSLTRPVVNSDTLTKDIAATTTTGLDNNSWGYALNDSSTYYAVPKKGTTAATVYNEAVARTSAYTVPIKFGVKTNNELPSGTYTNDVVYTMTPKSGCNSYSVTWNYDGGTAKSGATYSTSLSWGQTVNLSTLTPTRSGYTFAGWTNGTNDFTGTETAANLNSSNSTSITVTAKWTSNCNDGLSSVGASKNFDYTGSVQTFNACTGRTYKLEVWGAQGGNGACPDGYSSSTTDFGGKGAYSYGMHTPASDVSYFIVVGKVGNAQYGYCTNSSYNFSSYNQTNTSGAVIYGGYNGGGNGYLGAGGGGATHIATRTGTLSTLSSYKSTVLIVAGGGGGANIDATSAFGGNGGGFYGGLGKSANYSYATQSSGYSFGLGGSTGSSGNVGGGGGGYYGGYQASGSGDMGGGGGSGYIGGVTSGGMYMYNGGGGCTSSSETATKTTCTSNYSSSAVSNYAKTGNGYARITRQS